MTRILIVGPSWIGDMVMAQSLFKALKAETPSAEIHVAAPPWALPLTERMPEVARGWSLETRRGKIDLGPRRELAKALREQEFSLSILLPNSLKSALLPWFAGIPKRRGYRGESRYFLVNEMHKLDKTVLPLTVQRFVALAQPTAPSNPPAFEQPRLQADSKSAKTIAASLGLETKGPIAGLCPGAEYGPAKQWPLPYFHALAERLSSKGDQVWIFGSPNDVAAGTEIAAGLDPGLVKNLCAKTSLLDAVDLMSLTDRVVSNDSGLMHVAAALNKPLAAIFGSSSPAMTPPLSDKAAILEVELDCRPCMQRTCPLGHLNCLKMISVDEVEAALGG